MPVASTKIGYFRIGGNAANALMNGSKAFGPSGSACMGGGALSRGAAQESKQTSCRQHRMVGEGIGLILLLLSAGKPKKGLIRWTHCFRSAP